MAVTDCIKDKKRVMAGEPANDVNKLEGQTPVR